MAARSWEGRQRDVAPIFERAKERDELDGDADPDILFALAAGALYFRTIVMALPIDEARVDATLGSLLPALRASPAGRDAVSAARIRVRGHGATRGSGGPTTQNG